MGIVNCSSNLYCPIQRFLFHQYGGLAKASQKHPLTADLNEIFDGSALLLTGSLRAWRWYTVITDGVITRSYIMFLSMACSRKITFAHEQRTLEGGRTREMERVEGKRWWKGEEDRWPLPAGSYSGVKARRDRLRAYFSGEFRIVIPTMWLLASITPSSCVFAQRLHSLYSFARPLIPQPHNKCLLALPQASLLPLTHVCFFEYLAKITRHWSVPSFYFSLFFFSFFVSVLVSYSSSK